MTDDKVPYLKCLWHESKKAYKIYLIGLAIISAIIGICYVIWATKDEFINAALKIGNVFSSIPLWVYAITGVVAAPFVYAAVKCLWIRNNRTLPEWIGLIIVFIGCLIIVVALAIHNPETVNDSTAFLTAMAGVIVLFLGVGLWMVSE